MKCWVVGSRTGAATAELARAMEKTAIAVALWNLVIGSLLIQISDTIRSCTIDMRSSAVCQALAIVSCAIYIGEEIHMPKETLPTDLKLNDFLCFAVYAAGHGFNRVYKPLLQPLGLTYPPDLVMTALWEQDDQTVGGLGERLSLESNTLKPLLKRLENQRRIRRVRDPRDERQVRVRLTAAGRALGGG